MTRPVWRYLPGGRERHALYQPADDAAVCGAVPRWYVIAGWYGFGAGEGGFPPPVTWECRCCVAILAG